MRWPGGLVFPGCTSTPCSGSDSPCSRAGNGSALSACSERIKAAWVPLSSRIRCDDGGDGQCAACCLLRENFQISFRRDALDNCKPQGPFVVSVRRKRTSWRHSCGSRLAAKMNVDRAPGGDAQGMQLSWCHLGRAGCLTAASVLTSAPLERGWLERAPATA